ncbi:MAG: hypothetical protein IIA33_10950 [Planctomycetes bacterium]|nr:hypothetical protein [Planctomycetota bacterium]
MFGKFDYQAWTIKDGLPQNSVTSIVQTRDGYLWLGTFGGLARFDGVRFKIFDISNTEALASNRILSLLEDRSGNLWIGTQGGGVVRLRDGVFTSYRGQENAPSGQVRSIVEDGDGVVWFGAEKLVKYVSGRFESAGPDEWITPVKRVWSLLVDREQSLWVATTGGLGRFRDRKWRVFEMADGLIRNDVRFMHEDGRGLLWVRTGGRLFHLDGDKFVEVLVQGEQPGRIFAAALDGGGNYWVGSDRGLFHVRAVREDGDGSSDRTLFQRAIEQSAAGAVRTLLEDREGNLWVGTDGDGLLRLRAAPFKPFKPPPGMIVSSNVESLAGDGGGGLWIACSPKEIGHLKDDEWSELPADNDIRDIRAISSSSDGTLWIQHHGRTRLSKYRDGQFTHLEQEFDSIASVLVDRQGTVWISSAGGLSTIRDGRIETITVADGLPSMGGAGVLSDSRDGTIWIGADGALTRYRNGEFNQYTSEDGLPRGRVRSIHEGSDGNLWIATYGGGMARLRDGKFTRYTTLEGLPDNSLGKILEDDAGSLWVNSNRGVFRADNSNF